MTNIHMINELNNNTLFAGNAKKKIQLPDSVVDCKNDIGSIPGLYTKDDGYRPYTIYGNSGDDDKLSVLHPSATGSLSSITTTSLVSEQGASDGAGSDRGDDRSEKQLVGIKHEKWWQTTIQVAIPFFIAGIGTIGAGIILGRVESNAEKRVDKDSNDQFEFLSFFDGHWEVFKHIPQLFILVPALLGLKGNLDMTLASRLSTQANLGNMTSAKEITHMIVGNIALVQVQATVAAFIVSLFSMGVGTATSGSFHIDHALLMTSSAMFTATSSCFVLDFVLIAVILLSNRYKVNPDNMATPLAASIGDVVSIAMLSFITKILFENLETHLWITYIVIGCYFTLLPFWAMIVLRNRYTRPVLKSGWVPVLSALFISGMGGIVLEQAVNSFSGFVVFQPIINGIGGNLVSVQASKISTMLHQSTLPGILPPHAKIFEMPWRALMSGTPYAKTARILILMSIPGQVLFIFLADYIHMGQTTIGAPFMLSYLSVSFIQVMILLFIAHVMIHAMWRYKIDPDSSSIPYLTALGDLLGSSLLLLAFVFLRYIGKEYESKANVLLAATENSAFFSSTPSSFTTTAGSVTFH